MEQKPRLRENLRRSVALRTRVQESLPRRRARSRGKIRLQAKVLETPSLRTSVRQTVWSSMREMRHPHEENARLRTYRQGAVSVILVHNVLLESENEIPLD